MPTIPIVSVLLPTRDGAAFLPEAIESLDADTANGALEVVAVDDGSTDDTVATLERFAARLPLRVISRPVGNWVENTNLALTEARGQFVALLHQDDRWVAGRTARVLAEIAADDAVEVIVSDARFIDARGARIGRWRCPFGRRSRVVAPADWFGPLLVQNFLAIGAPVVRRDLLLAVGGLDASLRYAADWKLWLQLAARAPARYLAEPTVEFRVHGGAQTLALARHPGEFRRQLDAVLADAMAAPPAGISDVEGWMRLARFSVIVNQTLSARAVGRREPLGPLAREAWGIGPRGVYDYLRYSRILERATARLRAGVVAPA